MSSMELPYEKQFHFGDGTSAATLEQLKAKIENIGYQDFYRHVNTAKNDFSSWVRYVLKEEQLADDLQKVTSIVETVEIIDDYLHPRSVSAPRIDTQSRIEQSIFANALPSETGESLNIETVPTTAPTAPTTNEVLDFDIIEEKIAAPQVQKELFDSAPEQKAPPKQEPMHEDTARLIVKDFMYGLVFGLVVGLILGRIIS